jgi:hypothetical protein
VKVFKNRTITKEAIVLEEVCLIDCTLSDCDVFYSGGDADYQNLKLDNSRFHFRGAAQKTVQTLVSFGMLNMQPMPVSFQATSAAKAN